MDRITRGDHPTRRTVPLAAALLLTAAAFAVRTPGSIAAVNSCRARDVTQDSAWGSDLQAVIRAATTGDVVAVKFVCVGIFKIAKDLTLIGRPTADLPRGVLNGDGHGQVLVVGRAHVTLENLKITGGAVADWNLGGGVTTEGTLVLKDMAVKGNAGGGIYNTGTLTLTGSSTVSHNSAAGIHQDGSMTVASLTMNGTSSVTSNGGYGIFNYYALTTLNDSSTVSRNVTDVFAGIYNFDGTLTLNDSASVTDNVGTQAAVVNVGTFTMNGSSSVSGNTTTNSWGGGIYNASSANIAMNDSSSVTGNATVRSGGGIRTDGVLTMNGSSSVTDNTADSDDNGVGGGGGIKVPCSGTLIGAVDGGNVTDNHRGTTSPVLDNVAIPPCP